MTRVDAQPAMGGVLAVTFFRHEAGIEPEHTTLACDHSWVTFLRSAECALPAPFVDEADHAPEADARWRAPPPPSGARAANVTLVTQLTADRHWMLLELARRWPGPVSAAVMRFTGEPSVPALPPSLEGQVRISSFRSSRSEAYPINAMRNVAISKVATTHFMLTDVDLWPSSNLALELSRLDRSFFGTPRAALIVAAFQPDPHRGGQQIEHLTDGLDELRNCL